MTSIMSDVIAGRIELLDPLARGGTGSLWRAIDRRYGAICAAKVMRQRDGADVLRFVREQTVGTAQGLGAHPHLLPPYTWAAEDDTIVLVMPLVHGGTLSEAVADHGPLAPSLVAHLLRQLLDALAAMHEASWVHRDVKPANLLLDLTGAEEPHLLLADFGIALHESDVRLTATGLVHGTPGYMAPEVLEGQTSTTSQDVWAAAACALEALMPPPRGERPTAMELPSRLAPALAGSADPVAPLLEQVLSAMFATDPQARPCAAQARDALPRPTGRTERWSLTAGGERFEVFDQVEPLDAGSPGHGAPEVPLNGPDELAALSPSLHTRITARTSAASTTLQKVSTTPQKASTEDLAPAPTRPDPVPRRPAAPSSAGAGSRLADWGGAGAPIAGAAQPGRRSRRIGLLLLTISAVCLIAAVALVFAALGSARTTTAGSSPSATGQHIAAAPSPAGEGSAR